MNERFRFCCYIGIALLALAWYAHSWIVSDSDIYMEADDRTLVEQELNVK